MTQQLADRARELVKEVMHNDGLTWDEVAERTGVNRRTLARILNGETSLSFEQFDKLMTGLGYTVEIRVI